MSFSMQGSTTRCRLFPRGWRRGPRGIVNAKNKKARQADDELQRASAQRTETKYQPPVKQGFAARMMSRLRQFVGRKAG